jgi:tRNA dimethylallyltransferase
VALVSHPRRCVCITGPTACGKTELALRLAQAMPIEIISMDSAMVYRGMDIGTAKPDSAARAAVPHHLIDILDPAQAYSAGRFAHDALEALGAVTARGRLPVLVGGTLL